MKKIICVLFIVILFSVNSIYIRSNAEEQMEQIIVEVEQLANEPVIEEVVELKVKTEEDIRKEKQIEFYEKLEEIKQTNNNKELFLKYKNLTSEYMKWVDLPETLFDAFSEEEIHLLYRVVETECYQQDFESKVNVANVIFNRYYNEKFGETISDVITAPKQFAYGRKVIDDDTMLAVQYAYEFEDTTQGALYFHSNKKTDTFYGAKFIFQDDAGHNFYKPNV